MPNLFYRCEIRVIKKGKIRENKIVKIREIRPGPPPFCPELPHRLHLRQHARPLLFQKALQTPGGLHQKGSGGLLQGLPLFGEAITLLFGETLSLFCGFSWGLILQGCPLLCEALILISWGLIIQGCQLLCEALILISWGLSWGRSLLCEAIILLFGEALSWGLILLFCGPSWGLLFCGYGLIKQAAASGYEDLGLSSPPSSQGWSLAGWL